MSGALLRQVRVLQMLHITLYYNCCIINIICAVSAISYKKYTLLSASEVLHFIFEQLHVGVCDRAVQSMVLGERRESIYRVGQRCVNSLLTLSVTGGLCSTPPPPPPPSPTNLLMAGPVLGRQCLCQLDMHMTANATPLQISCS